MTIILTKDGHIVTDDGNPIEGVKLDGAAMILADPQAGQVVGYSGGVWQPVSPALYVSEAAGAGETVVLDKTYAAIKAASEAGKTVIIKAESEGTVTLAMLASYGGDDESGYTVTAGGATYTAATVDGVLTKEAET